MRHHDSLQCTADGCSYRLRNWGSFALQITGGEKQDDIFQKKNMAVTTTHRIATFLWIWWSRCIPLVTVCSTATTLDVRRRTTSSKQPRTLSSEKSLLRPPLLSNGSKSMLGLENFLRESNAAPPNYDTYYYEAKALERHYLKTRLSLPKSEKKHLQRLGKGQGAKRGTKSSKFWPVAGKGSKKVKSKGKGGKSKSTSISKASNKSKNNKSLSSKTSKSKSSKMAKQASPETLKPAATSLTPSTAPALTIAPVMTETLSPTGEPVPTIFPALTVAPTKSPASGPIPTISPVVAPTASPVLSETDAPVSPTIAPSQRDPVSVAPTRSPAPGTIPTISPIEAPTASPVLSETDAPVSPTIAPSQRDPNAPTRAPSDGILFDVVFEIPSGTATDADLSAAGEVTIQYLQDFYATQFEFSTATNLESVEGMVAETNTANVSALLEINVMFANDSQFFPSTEDVAALLFAAFQQPSVGGLITMLSMELPASNPLSATTQVEAALRQ